MVYFTGLTKVLVTAGKDEGSKKIEVIDLIDPTNVCQPSGFENYPFDQVVGASGGLLNNNIALICAGSTVDPDRISDDCFAITENSIIKVKLTQPRAEGAAVVLNGNNLWLTGRVSIFILTFFFQKIDKNFHF
jgi:hypothetical protein